MIEEWRQIPGYEGYYEISSIGNCRSMDRYVRGGHGEKRFRKGKEMGKTYNNQGYVNYLLSKDGKPKQKKAHKLMGIAFLEHNQDETKLIVHHINNIPSDNRLVNLELRTKRDNCYTHYKGTSKYTGVTFIKANVTKKWKGQIRDGAIKMQKNFEYEFEAFMWYEKQKRLILS